MLSSFATRVPPHPHARRCIDRDGGIVEMDAATGAVATVSRERFRCCRCRARFSILKLRSHGRGPARHSRSAMTIDSIVVAPTQVACEEWDRLPDAARNACTGGDRAAVRGGLTSLSESDVCPLARRASRGGPASAGPRATRPASGRRDPPGPASGARPRTARSRLVPRPARRMLAGAPRSTGPGPRAGA